MQHRAEGEHAGVVWGVGGGRNVEGVTFRAAVMVGTMSLADEAAPAYLQNCCTALTWSSS